MKLIISICALFLMTSQIHAQNTPSQQRELWNKSMGSFQFQVINSRIQPSIHVEVIDLIEKSRADHEVVYIDYKPNIRIKILPKSEINGVYTKMELIKHITRK